METNNNAEKKEVATGVNIDTGNKPSAFSLIDQANLAAERLENANKLQEQIFLQQQDLLAKQIIAGRAEGGTPPATPKELTPQEYAREILQGRINPLVV